MPRRSKSKKLSTSVAFADALHPVLNENIIICIPITAIEGIQTAPSVMTQASTLYTYNPQLSTPSESHMGSFQDENAWIDGSEDANSFHPFEKANVSHISRQKMEAEVAQTISSLNEEKQNFAQKQTCMWCCHTFETPQVHLPLQKKQDEFIVYGSFCSVHCAAAYNFNDILEFGDTWERYSLLHSLYFNSDNTCSIKLAPPRVSLNMFGGELSIDEFRDTLSRQRFTRSLAPIKYIKTYSTGSTKVLQNVKQSGTKYDKIPLKTPFTILQQRG